MNRIIQSLGRKIYSAIWRIVTRHSWKSDLLYHLHIYGVELIADSPFLEKAFYIFRPGDKEFHKLYKRFRFPPYLRGSYGHSGLGGWITIFLKTKELWPQKENNNGKC
jgi:hypothetical protein